MLRLPRHKPSGPAARNRHPPAHRGRSGGPALTRPARAPQLGTHLRAKNKREDMTQALRKMRCAALPRVRACFVASNSDGRAPADAHSPRSLLQRCRAGGEEGQKGQQVKLQPARAPGACAARRGRDADLALLGAPCARVLLTATLVVTSRVFRHQRRTHAPLPHACRKGPKHFRSFATSAVIPKPRSGAVHMARTKQTARCVAPRAASPRRRRCSSQRCI